jgi:DNA-binding MarR family transcriptional regulator
MNYMARLSRVSSHIMTLTGFFHGIFRMGRPLPTEVRTNVVRHRILKCLERRGPHHLTEISATLSIKKNTLSELLDRMVRDGLVARELSPNDRRVTRLQITPAGRSAIQEFERSLMGNIGEYLKGLDAEDRRDLVTAMESLTRILERHERTAGAHFPL